MDDVDLNAKTRANRAAPQSAQEETDDGFRQ